ncbi:MAG: hypothetical protein M0P64_00055 [Candidatus Pacebacteria bacterium]|jgi:hypothetical protein|nr:hypothetical protein [Candidatus Paceibacterota bacterium]
MSRYFRTAFVALTCAYFWYYAQTYTAWHFIDNVNLIFHEAGHAIFFFAGEFFQIAAGSIFQAMLPLVFVGYFFINAQNISAVLCLLWVGQNLLNISVYAGDAVMMNLPLLGGDAVEHDWNYILSSLDILRYTPTIASCIYGLGIAFLVLGTASAIYFAWTKEDQARI